VEKFPYADPAQSVDDRVADLIPRLTIEEKIGQLCMLEVKHGVDFLRKWHVGAIIHQFGDATLHYQKEIGDAHRLKIPVLMSLDCIHGHAFFPDATIFPVQLGMSCSWNTELAQRAGRITAREMAATGVHWTFSPLLDIARDLRWGRINETFGEDPYLAGALGAAIIRGYQGEKLSDPDSVLACAKHFAGYCDTIGGRDSSECMLSERQLRHDILPPYQAAVDAGCATVMAGYHSLDGRPCSASAWLLTDVLRTEMKFRGFVVSDWENVNHFIVQQQITDSREDAAAILVSAGNDMSMATSWFPEAALAAIRRGLLSTDAVDEACRRVLRIKFMLGLFDHKRYPDLSKIKTVVGCAEHLDAALESGIQSIVLLENRNNTLPLASKAGKIAVAGPNADDIIAQLGDWAVGPGGYPEYWEKNAAHLRGKKVTFLDEIRRRAKKADAEVTWCRACDVLNSAYDEIDAAVSLAKEADMVIAVVGDNRENTGEHHDRADLDLSGKQQHMLEALKAAGKPLIVILLAGKPHTIGWASRNADALIAAFNPGIRGGEALAGILFGDYNPSGKLTVSFPWHVGQQPVRYNQPTGWHGKGDYSDMPDDYKFRMYAFGFGRSYTTFAYSDLKVKSPSLKRGEDLKVSVTVANTGARAGTEIVQLYIHDIIASVTQPPKKLRAFARVDLKPGESTRITMAVAFDQLAVMSMDNKRVVEAGEFEALIGGSSRDEDLLKAVFRVA
jgi:beta-glucosidase